MTFLAIMLLNHMRSASGWNVSFPRIVLIFTILFASAVEPQSEDNVGGARGVEVRDCTVRFAKEVRVPALESGLVANIDVAVNDAVQQGSALAKLDDRSLLIQRRAALARQLSAKQDAESSDEIEYAETVRKQAQAEHDARRSTYNQAPGAVPFFDVLRLELAVKRSELEIKQAQQRKRRAGAELELRSAELSLIDNQLRQLYVESPIDGVVLEVMRSEGEWVQKGEPVATIGKIDRLHVRALLSTDQIGPEDCIGLPVSVHWVDPTSGQSRSLRGEVRSVDPQVISGGRFVRLHAEIVNRKTESGSHWLLSPGAEVRMTIYPQAPSVTRDANGSSLR